MTTYHESLIVIIDFLSCVTTTFYPSYRSPSKNNRAGSPKKGSSTGPPKGGKIKTFPICRWCSPLCKPGPWGIESHRPAVTSFCKMFRTKGQLEQNRNISDSMHRGHDIQRFDRFPRESFLIPRQISGLTTTHSQAPEGRLQPLLDKIGKRLPGWKGKMLSTAGRETLVKSMLTSQPIYHLTVFPTQ